MERAQIVCTLTTSPRWNEPTRRYEGHVGLSRAKVPSNALTVPKSYILLAFSHPRISLHRRLLKFPANKRAPPLLTYTLYHSFRALLFAGSFTNTYEFQNTNSSPPLVYFVIRFWAPVYVSVSIEVSSVFFFFFFTSFFRTYIMHD